MKEEYSDIDILLAKKLAGEANAEEQHAIEGWLSDSAGNKTYFEDLERLWEQAPQARVGKAWEVDTEAALQKVKTQTQQQPATRFSARSFPNLMRIAAVLVLVSVAIWFIQKPTTLPQSNIASNNATLTDTLTDGSVVVLNRNSGLRIADNFNRKERRMRLTGEAYFHVAHDTVRPFVVEAEQLEISVVGTEFNVQNQANSNSVTVSVTSGKVRLRTATQSELLTAGQQAVYDISSKKITRLLQPNPNVLAYKTRIFTFDATPLETVVKQLNSAYGVNIILKNNNLSNCPLNTRFDNLALDQILEIIAESFSLSIERKPDAIILDGQGCREN